LQSTIVYYYYYYLDGDDDDDNDGDDDGGDDDDADGDDGDDLPREELDEVGIEAAFCQNLSKNVLKGGAGERGPFRTFYDRSITTKDRSSDR
jgi:hypothetical protein